MNGRIVRENQTARLPILGKIKIGTKIKNSKGIEYPTSLDYFIADGKYKELFNEAFGTEPRRVPIVFISDNPSDSCNESYQVRDKAGRLLAEGDGRYWKAFNAGNDKYDYNIEATLAEIEAKYPGPITTKVTLTLRFILPSIPGVFGVWQLTTNGINSSIPAIRDTYDQVQEMAGTVINIPFDLVVEKVKSQKPGSAAMFPVIQLIPNVSPDNMNILAEFVQSGARLRGILTDAKIEEIKKNNFAILPEHVDEVTGEIIDDIPQLPAPEVKPDLNQEVKQEEKPEPKAVTTNEPIFTQKDYDEVVNKALEIGFTEDEFKTYMRNKGFIPVSTLPLSKKKEILRDIDNGTLR